MIDLPGQKILSLFRPFPLGNIDGNAADAYDAAGLVDGRGRRADAPANFTIGPNDSKLGFVGSSALVELDHRLAQFVNIVGVQQRLNIGRIDDKALRIDAENPELSFVPHPVAVDPVPVPGTHSAFGKSKTAALLAFEEPCS